MIDTKEFELTRAHQFQALADPVRLEIVATLDGHPRCVCEIQAAVGPIAANLLSYHLGILRGAGLVQSKRRGRWLDYSLDLDAFANLRASLPQPVAGGAGGSAPSIGTCADGAQSAPCGPRRLPGRRPKRRAASPRAKSGE